MILVALEPRNGTIKRYECWAGGVRLTHSGTRNVATTFCRENVDMMFKAPPEALRVQPDVLHVGHPPYTPPPAA